MHVSATHVYLAAACDALFTTVPTARTNAALLTPGGDRHNYLLIGLETGRYAWCPHVPLYMLCTLGHLQYGELLV